MKNILFILAFASLAFSFTSCNNNHGKKASGQITNESRTVSSFNKIDIEGIFPVEIAQTGEGESVKVETDESLQSYIEVYTKDSCLYLKSKEKVSLPHSSKTIVHVNIKNINQLDSKSVGNLTTTDTLKLDSLQLSSESVGKLNISINANYLHADLNSVGSTTFAGKVYEVRINNESVGTLSAYDLKASALMIHNTAVGTAEVYADSVFYIRSSSIGGLFYKGPGAIKELSSEGIGKVQKED